MNQTPKNDKKDTDKLSLEEMKKQVSEETLAQRSARLEAEAMALQQQREENENSEEFESPSEQDPLAPEPENIPFETADTINISDANTTVIALQKEIEETKDKLMRAVAETENTRRRALKEREDARKYSIAGFSRDILSVADNLRRALEAIPPEFLEQHAQIKNLVDGIEATERELLRTFEKNNITKLEPTLDGDGEIFNPNLHEVMFEAPGTGKPAGTIIQIMEPGYMLHDRLLRPARVGVAKDDGGATDQSDTSENASQPDTPHIDTEA